MKDQAIVRLEEASKIYWQGQDGGAGRGWSII